MKNLIKKPILILAGIIICLIMLRLGVWQLDRAQSKQQILDQQVSFAQQTAKDLVSLETLTRFQAVTATGHYIDKQSILIDNTVVLSQLGYWLFTPFKIDNSEQVVMVNRGWLAGGATKADLPDYQTPQGRLQISGRLNNPPAKPPIWNDKYPVHQANVWQFLPIDQYAQKLQLNVLPLVLELAPDLEDVGGYLRKWPDISNEWVNKHKAYAVQWFAMAVAFFIACLVLLIRSFSKD